MLKRKIPPIVIIAAMVAAIAANSYALPVQKRSATRPMVYVTLKKPGEIYVGNRRTSPGQLVADIQAEDGHAAHSAVRIYIRSNATIGYNEFQRYLTILQRAGYTSIGLLGSDASK